MKEYLTTLNERVKQRINKLRENDKFVRINENKIKEIEELMRTNESIIKQNYEKIKENKTKINLNKKAIRVSVDGLDDYEEIGRTSNDSLQSCINCRHGDSVSLAKQILKISEDNLELCRDNLNRTIQDRDRIVEIQSICLTNTKRNRQNLCILHENIAEMMSIARILWRLTEEENIGEKLWRKNGFMRNKGTEIELGSSSQWRQCLINFLQKLFDDRNKVFDYKSQQKEDQSECVKRKTATNEIIKNKRLKLPCPRDLRDESDQLCWQVKNVPSKINRSMEGDVQSYLLSRSFASHVDGYRLCLCLHLNGFGDGLGSHLSVSYHLQRGTHDDRLQWPFQGSITVSVAIGDSGGGGECRTRTYSCATVPAELRFTFDRPMRSRAVGWGDSLLIPLEEVAGRSAPPLDGTVFIRCRVSS